MYSTVPQNENVFLSSTASLLSPKSIRREGERRGGERDRERRERETEREREGGRDEREREERGNG